MQTYFLGSDEIEGYGRDLIARLIALGPMFPRLWCVLGISGQTFANSIFDFLPPDLKDSLEIVRVSANRDNGAVTYQDELPALSTDRPVLLLDSAVHSGRTMLNVASDLIGRGAKDVATYTLILKRNSHFVPSFFGLLIGENDRALFQLEEIPNSRLSKVPPFGIVRLLSPDDVDKSFPVTGEADIDSSSFGTLLYESETKGSIVYVFEHGGGIQGVLSFIPKHQSVFVDLVANSSAYRGKGVGAALMRWAETWARSNNSLAIDLWAIENRLDFYISRRFEAMSKILRLGEKSFHLMRRKLLYNSSLVRMLD